MPGLMASTRPSGWIKGIVREVTSGDTLVIASAPRPGAPEKRITLSSLISPKLVRHQRQLTVIIPFYLQLWPPIRSGGYFDKARSFFSSIALPKQLAWSL